MVESGGVVLCWVFVLIHMLIPWVVNSEFCMLVIFLYLFVSPPLPYNISQADVGPFVPQRFEPPADAYGNEARGVRQVGDTELGDSLFSRASSLVNESRPTLGDRLLEKEKDGDGTKGYQMGVDKKIEWGIINQHADPAEQNPSYLGHSLATQRSQVEVKKEMDKKKKEKSWQPSQNRGSSSSSWWQESWQPSQSWFGWQQAGWEEEPEWTQDPWQQSWNQWTPARMSYQPLIDHRGEELISYWGSGAKQ